MDVDARKAQDVLPDVAELALDFGLDGSLVGRSAVGVGVGGRESIDDDAASAVGAEPVGERLGLKGLGGPVGRGLNVGD